MASRLEGTGGESALTDLIDRMNCGAEDIPLRVIDRLLLKAFKDERLTAIGMAHFLQRHHDIRDHVNAIQGKVVWNSFSVKDKIYYVFKNKHLPTQKEFMKTLGSECQGDIGTDLRSSLIDIFESRVLAEPVLQADGSPEARGHLLVEKTVALAETHMTSERGYQVCFSKDVLVVPHAGWNSLVLPSAIFIDRDDIPSQFLVSGPDDPKLKDEKFLLQAYHWLSAVTGKGKGVSGYQSYQRSKPLLPGYLVFMSQSKSEIKKCLQFVILHEFTHIAHSHSHQYLWWTAGVHCLSEMRKSRESERDADSMAVKILGDSEGGEKLFAVCDQTVPRALKWIFTTSHYSFMDRIDHLKDVLKEK
ncbi:MAG: hypothetical protein P0S95_02020 [Rhabdochlamydiaceae bacterium]|nr:hypothetical protein [Candidatus Amphrikana amoebophyrae]